MNTGTDMNISHGKNICHGLATGGNLGNVRENDDMRQLPCRLQLHSGGQHIEAVAIMQNVDLRSVVKQGLAYVMHLLTCRFWTKQMRNQIAHGIREMT